MNSSSPIICPSCGREASGKFCGNCGASLSPGASAADRIRWMAGGGVVGAGVTLLLVMLARNAAPPPAVASNTDAPFAAGVSGAPPDISNMSPRERFDRLYNRIMTAAENGDENTANRFAPMALSAYSMLDSIDADARYHAALIELHTGDIDGATALGDTILLQSPGHLLGYVVLGTVARFRKDDAALRRAYSGFLQHYDAEMKAGRAEYSDHERSITDFKKSAEAMRSPA